MKAYINIKNKTILVTDSPRFTVANHVIRIFTTLTSGTIASYDNMNDNDGALKT